jgi:diaminopimelate epimerase
MTGVGRPTDGANPDTRAFSGARLPATLRPMGLQFTKMHGAGNDFVLVDGTAIGLDLDPGRIRALADRHRGIGFDQLLVAEPAARPDAHLRMRIYNADGSEAGQCGNGLRCFAMFARERGLAAHEELRVETRDRVAGVRLLADGRVRVDMGVPTLEPQAVPFQAEADRPLHELEVDGERVEVSVVSMGNPHAVVRVADVAGAPVGRLGPRIEVHPRFPAGVNVGFLEVVDVAHVRLRVHERGVGETLACGSGACAAMVVGRRLGWLSPGPVAIDLPGGCLEAQWEGMGAPVWLTGPVATVFRGETAGP